MLKEMIEYAISVLKSRIFPLVLVFLGLAAALIMRLFNLQIVNGEQYLADISKAVEDVKPVSATRGRIYDTNGELLAYNELAFSINISDSGFYANTSEKNKTLNEIIYRTVRIIEGNNETVSCDFSIVLNEDNRYEYTVDGVALLRFLRDCYGRSNINLLSEEQKNATAEEVMRYLCEEKYEISTEYSKADRIKIVNVRSYMTANLYNRSMEYTLAYDVSDETVAEIVENSDILTGVRVSEEYIRKYVDGKYAAHIIGYTGKASSDELATLVAQNPQYAPNDVVGKSGIEQSMELYLQGTKGERRVYVDTVGRIKEVISETAPVTGDDVYLTIDINLQKQIYHAIEEELAKILVSKIVNSTEKYTYKADETTIKDIFIPIRDVYFALIDNNVIKTSGIAQATTSTERMVYEKFLEKQDAVMVSLHEELTGDTPTLVSKLSDENYEYIKYIYSLLKTEGIVMTEAVDESDEIFLRWKAETISLKDYLSYAIAMNWIDVSMYSDDEYTSLSEAYEQLITFIFDVLRTDSGFSKIIYKYMIHTGRLSGTEICILLYDQGILPYDEDTYGKLIVGIVKPYDFIVNKIENLEITPAQLALEPCSGSVVITDVNTGQVKALVSYPSYDNNRLSITVDAEYYQALRNDKSGPLYNGAAQSQNAPGSTFKIVSSIAGLMNNVITTGESIYCNGIYETVYPNPKCWVYPASHGNETVKTAIRDSCNIFFYEVGYRLSIDSNGNINSELATNILADYARKLGLATKTNIEIYESAPNPSNINPTASAIGQGNHGYTALNLSRYAATIATNGVCHDFTLIQSIVDCTGSTIYSSVPIVASTMNEVPDNIWDAVHEGMYLAGQNNTYIRNLSIPVGCKSGTAQENTKKPDHATFILYAPYDEPEIAVSAIIRNGYASGNVAELSAEIVKIYYGQEESGNE